MKKALLALALLALIPIAYRFGYRTAAHGSLLSPGLWRPVAALPFPHVEAPAVIDGDRLYVFGGFSDRELRVTPRVDIFEFGSGEWRRGADMPVKITHHLAGRDGRRLWFVGGYAGDHKGVASTLTLLYDLDANSWSEGPALPEPRAGGGLVVVGRTLHYFGGLKDRDETAREHWALDLDSERRWRPLAPLPENKTQFGTAALDGRIYAIGGQLRHDTDPVDLASVHAYDPATDRWIERASLPEATSHIEPSTLAVGDRIVVMGGRQLRPRSVFEAPVSTRSAANSKVWSYDPAADAWAAGPGLPIGLLGAFAVQRADAVWIGGGSTFLASNPQLTIYAGRPLGD